MRGFDGVGHGAGGELEGCLLDGGFLERPGLHERPDSAGSGLDAT